MTVTDIQDTGQELPRANGSAKGVGQAGGGPALREKAGKATQALKDGAQRGVEAARAQMATAGQKLTSAAQERPVASFSTVLAVGLLAGFAIGVFVGQATAD